MKSLQIIEVLSRADPLRVGKVWQLKGSRMLIGRREEDCEICLYSAHSNQKHAEIVDVNGKSFIEDLCSREGTYVNNVPIRVPTELVDGDIISIGQVIKLRFQESSTPATGSLTDA